ncbi:MAG: FtsX-like permease family protein [Rhodocyclaceae bacterium]|nr:FtsX-like permease family protein [Rhodocyclaceae bacterium]
MKLGLWLAAGELRAHPWRLAATLAAIAVGVALGLAVHLINASAVTEFSQAVRATTGQADLEIRGPRAGFDDAVLERVAADADIALASPILDVDAPVLDAPGLAKVSHGGTPQPAPTLRIVGIDVFRAGGVTPGLIGAPADEARLALLADDTVFLSAAAQSWLGLAPGDTLTVQAGLAAVALRVAGGMPGARGGQRLASMDLGAAQWRLARLGRLSRIALRLAPGADRDAVKARLGALMPAGVFVAEPEDGDIRASNLSRAYRVNLDVLALVALFTGAFLVFSTQTLAVARRRRELALLRTLGWPARRLLRQVIAEGAAIGLAGGIAGVLAGTLAAHGVVAVFGSDLGGGFFAGVAPALTFDPLAATGFVALAIAAAVAGSLAPALATARLAPATALKEGAETARAGGGNLPGLALLLAGALLLTAPPIDGLPVAGYLAIACWLVGGIALMPGLAARAFGALARRLSPVAGRRPLAFLSAQRLAAAPGQAGIALAGIVASFALMVAMAIMVGSFRDSVSDWLDRVLAAPLYARMPLGATDFIPPDAMARIARHPDVERVEWMRLQQIDLDPRRPSVTLMARDLSPADPGARIPLTGQPLAAAELPAGTTPVWISEAMTDLYGWRLGDTVRLPLAGQAQPVMVAGIWRDFGRQHGTVVIQRAELARLAGNRVEPVATDVALWPRAGVPAGTLAMALRRDVPETARLEFAEPGEIRARSLRIFDRSFAVTYLLEIVAIGIGLAGIGTSFSAQALARAREFGMLRHLGVGRGQLMRLLALEAAGLTLFGVAAGGALGFAVALVLIRVVNPQSFHWRMELAVPWTLLAAVTALLVAAGVATALAATRQATGVGPLRAVREDW